MLGLMLGLMLGVMLGVMPGGRAVETLSANDLRVTHPQSAASQTSRVKLE